MTFRWHKVVATLIVALGLVLASGAPAEAATKTAGAKYAVSSATLASSTSISVVRHSYSRVWSRSGCHALEKVSIPLITRGGTSANRAVFNTKLRAVVANQIDDIIDDALDGAVAQSSTGYYDCNTSTDIQNYYGKISASASIYKNRYVSVVLHTFVNYMSASSCLDSYRTLTFDLSKGRWMKLSQFARSNYGQLAGTWLEQATGSRSPSIFYSSNPLSHWTVSSKGVRLYTESGVIGGCADGWRSNLVTWNKVMRPGDDSGTAVGYTVPFGYSTAGTETKVRVTRTGRQIKVRVCWEGYCVNYYGVRGGTKTTKVWRKYNSDSYTYWSRVRVYFTSTSTSAKPTFVVYGS